MADQTRERPRADRPGPLNRSATTPNADHRNRDLRQFCAKQHERPDWPTVAESLRAGMRRAS